MKERNSIVFFDGVCNLCNSSVDFVIARDKAHKFRFSSLQSEYAKKTLNLQNETDFGSFILYKDNKTYQKSTAALMVAKELDYPIKLIYAFIIIPEPIRNFIYSIIAKNRYRWFGKKETCRLPTPQERALFIE
jgi:predicted DCC family thiol-disulfide oxidoreductase YuxK